MKSAEALRLDISYPDELVATIILHLQCLETVDKIHKLP
jgi:hypothetical protein